VTQNLFKKREDELRKETEEIKENIKETNVKNLEQQLALCLQDIGNQLDNKLNGFFQKHNFK